MVKAKYKTIDKEYKKATRSQFGIKIAINNSLFANGL
jgi:hypothetical protein